MANTMLPKQINPIQLADNHTTLKGELHLNEMERLIDLVYGDPGLAKIDLQFGRDKLGYRYIKGSIKIGFKVICQRCNSPMLLNLNVLFEASPVHSEEEAKRLPKNYDPLILTGDTISLNTMVEEELLLSIPIVPKHSLKECKISASELVEWNEEAEKTHPFKELKKLLRE